MGKLRNMLDTLMGMDETEVVGVNNLYYTDRQNEYQYGDDQTRVEVIVKEQEDGMSLTMQKLPSNRRFVQNDVVSMEHKNKGLFSRLFKFLGTDMEIPVNLELEGINPSAKMTTFEMQKAWLTVDKGTNGVVKSYLGTDKNGNEGMLQVFAYNDMIRVVELTMGSALKSEMMEPKKDEILVELPLCIAISEREVKLYNLLNQIGGYETITLSGCLS